MRECEKDKGEKGQNQIMKKGKVADLFDGGGAARSH